MRNSNLLCVILVLLWSCSSRTDDSYVSPPADLQAQADAKLEARNFMDSATYASVGKPFGCETDCSDEEIGFAEARRDKVSKSEDCTSRFSDESLLSNATQDGCRAYVQAFNTQVEKASK